MAFTTAQLVEISRALGISKLALDSHLIVFGQYIGTDAELLILGSLDEYAEFIGKSHIKTEPTTTNKGVRINFADKLETIKRNIADVLLFDMSAIYGNESPNQATFIRG